MARRDDRRLALSASVEAQGQSGGRRDFLAANAAALMPPTMRDALTIARDSLPGMLAGLSMGARRLLAALDARARPAAPRWPPPGFSHTLALPHKPPAATAANRRVTDDKRKPGARMRRKARAIPGAGRKAQAADLPMCRTWNRRVVFVSQRRPRDSSAAAEQRLRSSPSSCSLLLAESFSCLRAPRCRFGQPCPSIFRAAARSGQRLSRWALIQSRKATVRAAVIELGKLPQSRSLAGLA